MSDGGELPPVVLVHGFGTSAERSWRDNGWVDLLQDMGRTVLAVDLLGHGDAPKPHDPEAYRDMGGWLAEQLPDGPVDAVGFSFGAKTLLQLATQQPQRVRRLVVSGVGANLFRHDNSGLVLKAIRGEGDPANPVARYFAALAQEPGSDVKALEALMTADTEALTAAKLAAVACPTLVVLGDRDFAGPADPLVEALPDARLVTLRATDHFATPKDFRFLDAALEFLAGA